jgi:hypothetical protein
MEAATAGLAGDSRRRGADSLCAHSAAVPGLLYKFAGAAPKVEFVLASFGKMSVVLFVVLIVTAAMGIPIRLYLFTAAAFNYS